MIIRTIKEWKNKINESVNYQRVLPRDLFNESKLLKCIGQLILHIENRITPENLTYFHDDVDFKISQNESDGSISIQNIEFEYNGRILHFYTLLNNKEPYPLYVYLDDEECNVFMNDGILSPEFLEFLKNIENNS